MARFLKKNHTMIGKSPDALIFVGSQKVETIKTRVIDYDETVLSEKDLIDIKDGSYYKETETVTWININGLHNTDFIGGIGGAFDLHPLILESILNTGQRPKVEEFDNCIFAVLKMIQYDETNDIITSEQLSMVIGEKFLITFQERPGDVFEPVRDRIRRQKSRIRGAGTDYLAYALIDTLVDNYISIIERLGEKIEDLEDEILVSRNNNVMEKINAFKREINYLRKSIRPSREAISKILRTESPLIHESTFPFFKNLEDLIDKAAEAIEIYKDLLTDQLNIYNSVVANRMNDIMRILTIFAATFIPLTFIAGIYGTNFDYLPELHYKYSYFIFWMVLIAMAAALLFFFKRRKWF